MATTKDDHFPSAPPAPAEFSRSSFRDGTDGGTPKGLTVHDRIARKAAAGAAVPSAGPGPGSGSSASASKPRTPYILKSHRQSKLSSAPTATATATEEQAATGKPKPTAENEEEELTKEQQQARDLFGDDYVAVERVNRRYARPLDQNELKTRSVEELESYAIQRSQAVTQNIDDCVRVAEDTVGVASATMGSLHEQGSQIRRVHTKAARLEDDIKVGEKLLGSLGGMFSRKWKPKKTDKITGPQAADANKRKAKQADRAAVLSNDNYNIVPDPKSIAQARANRFAGLSETQIQLEVEKEYQEGALSDLGDVVSHLKNMTKEMNEEVEKQTEAVGHMEHDVDIVDNRVRQSYNRTRVLV